MPGSLKDNRLRLAHSDLLPLGEFHTDFGDPPGVAGSPDDRGVVFLNQLLVAADVVSVVVRVQNHIQPAVELGLDELSDWRRLGRVDDGNGARGLVHEDPCVVVAEARDAEDGEPSKRRGREDAAGRGPGLGKTFRGGRRHRRCRCLESTARKGQRRKERARRVG